MLSLSSPSNDNLISIGGNDYEINLAYDNVLRWFKLIASNLSQEEKVLHTFSMFVGQVDGAKSDDYINLFTKIQKIAFSHPYGNGEINNQEVDPQKAYFDRPFDYETDAEAIFASFMYDYGINLIKEKGRMSWSEFKALLDNLSDNSPLMRIVKIRKTDMGEMAKLHKGDAKFLGALSDQKDYYSLAQTPEERKMRQEYELNKAMEQLR